MSQTLTFENALKSLYFGIDVKKASSALVDTLMTVSGIHHSDTVIKQSDLNLYMQLQTDKEAWSYRHMFTFTKSPLPDLKIDSGYIEVLIGEAP